MKLHDLRPAAGAHTPRTRVGRGIAAGKGKTAGRGTKGQKSRAGGTVAAWFEGGQTPIHIRIPKLRGFRNANRIEYEVVNVGRISAAAEAGRLPEPVPGTPVTVTADLLRVAGLVRRLTLPLKVLGGGDVTVPLAVIADAVTKSARAKIEAAGGSIHLLELPAATSAGGEGAAPGLDAGSADAATTGEPVAAGDGGPVD